MTPNMTIEKESDRLAATQSHICKTCGRDVRDMTSLPCTSCPCRFCGKPVDRSKQLHKKDCSAVCKKAFEKAERTAALRMLRESRMAVNS